MKVELRLGGLIVVNGHDIAFGQTLALLDGIARERSVRGAANRLSVSYRSAWGRVATLETAIGQPIATKTKGHGTTLTPLGEALRSVLAMTLQRFEISRSREERSLEQRLAELLPAAQSALRIAASHDPLLLDVLASHPGFVTSVMGSEAALDKVVSGEADIAGFHFGCEQPSAAPPLRTLLDTGSHVAIPVFFREQGLILPSGNPLKIRSVKDLARKRARFINRQRGSGTRHWFERILKEMAIDANEVQGFEAEEFTHKAVAAVVASGAADVGMGVRAAAESFGLDFIPLGREAYFLVTLSSQRTSPALNELVAGLRSAAARTVGYNACEPEAPPVRTGRRSHKAHR